MARAGIILAAGKGTRMGSSKPKVMHSIAGTPMLGHVIGAMAQALLDPILVVTAPDADDVRAFAVAHNTQPVIVDRLLGPGYSAQCAARHLANFDGDVVVAYGDQPLVTASLFEASFAAASTSKMSSVVFRPETGATYGRVVLDSEAFIDRIVEFADATPAERAITLCSAGMFTMAARDLLHWTSFLTNQNRRSEYYLAELPAIARRDHARCCAVFADETEVMGVNTKVELSRAEALKDAKDLRRNQRHPIRRDLV